MGGSGGSCVAVSDDNGVFTYPSLSPGDYILVIQLNTLSFPFYSLFSLPPFRSLIIKVPIVHFKYSQRVFISLFKTIPLLSR